MTRKFLIGLVAILVTLAMVLPGCAEENGLGDPIELTFLIRTEDERTEFGDYGANVLEDLGFEVDRQYKTSGEASPIWLGDPDLGLWHLYTGGWVGTAVSRDEGANFGDFYTPLGWPGMPLWDAYEPAEEFLTPATTLYTMDFGTMAQREALFAECLPLSMNDSVRVWLVDRAGFSPLRDEVALAADAYGGIYGAWLWALTAHFRDGSGVPIAPTGNTTMRIATADLLVDPWNPVAGSNWAYDRFPQNALDDQGLEFDPQTGLAWPHKAESAVVTALDTLPMTLNPGHETWLTFNQVSDPIPVPGTVWADWDAVTDEWITAATRFGGNVTAKTKVEVTYPAGTVSGGIPLHDGSSLDEGDFLIYAIMYFDRAKPDSNIYDVSSVAAFEAFMSPFKGMEFTFGMDGSVTVTTYSDLWYMDPEFLVRDVQENWFPSDQYGQYVWPSLALGILAEEAGQLAFSSQKADAEEVDWMSYIAGPSLADLAGQLTNVLNSGHDDYQFIPYEPVIGDYITPSAAEARYTNLQSFYSSYEHFWVGSGPYYLYDVDTTADIIQLKRFAAYPDDATNWFFTMTPEPTTPWPAHTGGWVDDIVLTIEESAAAITKLQGDTLDVYAFAIADPVLKATVDGDPNLHSYLNAGSFNEFTLNPSGPFFAGTGKVNPFAIPEIRQALNWALDRDYIVGDIMGGLGFARYTCVGTQSGDAIRYADLIDPIETEYAWDFDRADAAIEAAMLTIPGVSRDVDGKYYYAP